MNKKTFDRASWIIECAINDLSRKIDVADKYERIMLSQRRKPGRSFYDLLEAWNENKKHLMALQVLREDNNNLFPNHLRCDGIVIGVLVDHIILNDGSYFKTPDSTLERVSGLLEDRLCLRVIDPSDITNCAWCEELILKKNGCRNPNCE